MVRLTKKDGNNICEFIALAADLVEGKPVIPDAVAKAYAAGSSFYVADTKAGFIFDGDEWYAA
jgi:hypothetical protein